jgi:hypothetical protein
MLGVEVATEREVLVEQVKKFGKALTEVSLAQTKITAENI